TLGNGWEVANIARGFSKLLKAMIERFGIAFDVTTPEQRRQMQRLVYLLQNAGKLDLGFHYHWTRWGSYSEKLAWELLKAFDEYAADPAAFEGYHLSSTVTDAIDRVKKLTSPPEDHELTADA